MDPSFIKKYEPKKLDNFEYNIQNTIKTLIKTDNLNFLLFGNSGSGKTTLTKIIIKDYYGDDVNYENNVLFINNLQDQGVNFCRNEVKSFCQTSSSIKNKKKIVVIDDLDSINEQVQHVFRNCLDKYKSNIHLIGSCENMQKIIESIKSRLSIIKIPKIQNETMIRVFDRVCKQENLNIKTKERDFMIKISENSIKTLLNYLEKLKLIDKPIDLSLVKRICSNVGYRECELFTKKCLDNHLEDAVSFILDIYNNGYSVIDILTSFFVFMKTTDLIDENLKYEIIKLICKYTTIFNELHEDQIELVFFTNNIIKLFSSIKYNEDTNIQK